MVPAAENAFPDTPLQAVADSVARPGGAAGGGAPSLAAAAAGPATLAAAFAAAPVTLVTIAFQGHGQAQLAPWHDAAREAFGGLVPAMGSLAGVGGSAAAATATPAGGPRVLNLLYLQGYLFRALSGVMLRSTRGALPPDVGDATALAFQVSLQATDVSGVWGGGGRREGAGGGEPPACRRGRRLSRALTSSAYPPLPLPQHWCDKLRLHNRAMGHVLLVDSSGLVRWRAHGMPAEGEMANMAAAARALLEEAAGRRGKGKGGGRGKGSGCGGQAEEGRDGPAGRRIAVCTPQMRTKHAHTTLALRSSSSSSSGADNTAGRVRREAAHGHARGGGQRAGGW
jgi:hypothetical protein